MYVNVLIETRVKSNEMTFTYHVPLELSKNLIGKRVLVPFGKRTVEAFVLEYTDFDNTYEFKDIIKVVDNDPVLNEELIDLGKFMSNKYLCPLISCYQVMLPKALKANAKNNNQVKSLTYVKLNNDITTSNIKIKSQLEIVNLLKENKEVLKSQIKSKSSLKKLIESDIVKEFKREVYRNVEVYSNHMNITLTKDQISVSNRIKQSLGLEKTMLIYGVTGSGKTEVYIDVVKEVIKNNKSAIILVPEISLTPQITSRFKGVFKERIAILHSSLSDGERYDEYRRISRGEVNVVIGARSAIFAPLQNLGIIIIDEEHSESYKQENNPRYNTLDIAFKRSKTHNCPVVLASATPTIESYARAKKGYYDYLELNKRINQMPLPKTSIIDMKKEVRNGNRTFSGELIQKIEDRLNKKEQVMLLLNRRGYSNYLMCTNCGYVFKCPNCDITLTFHKTSGMVRCHYCGYAEVKKDVCPSCKKNSISQIGSGTEKIEEEIKKEFNGVKVARMDADTTSKKGSHYQIINDFNEGKYDVLVGTQMIAKGLNFPNVTLVGVINADQSLNIPNFRSSELTFSLLNQVIGRSGRANKKGEAIIQTFNPDHYSIVCAANHDYVGFFNHEMFLRKKLNYPPYCFIILVKISSKDFECGIKEAKKASAFLRKNLTDATIVLGPSMANVLRINNNYNFQVILKYKKEEKLYVSLKELIKIYEGNSKIKIELDFNPINL